MVYQSLVILKQSRNIVFTCGPHLASTNKKSRMYWGCMATKENLVRVCVYDVDATVFQDSQEELLTLGYQLSFYNDLEASMPEAIKPDVYIVDVAKLDASKALLESIDKPYLVSGINFLDNSPAPSSALDNSVGFINGHPSVTDICVNIRLGLLWYKEREHFSRRGQDIDEKIRNNRMTGVAVGMLMQKTGLTEEDVLTCLKSTSRNKQRRMVDASCAVIEQIHKSKDTSLNSSAELSAWLDSTISHRT